MTRLEEEEELPFPAARLDHWRSRRRRHYSKTKTSTSYFLQREATNMLWQLHASCLGITEAKTS
jgi:hypothetical protein